MLEDVGSKSRFPRKAKEEKTISITIPAIDIREIELSLVGTSELIMHRFSEKMKGEIEKAQTGSPGKVSGRAPRNPQEEYEDSFYRDQAGHPCMPASAFKKAAVSAVSSLNKTFSKVVARQALHIVGDWVQIESKVEPYMRTDTVRLARGIGSLRYRPGFTEWSAKVRISYNASVISPEQIGNLFNLAGFAVGIGEWRPEKGGAFGRFRVV